MLCSHREVTRGCKVFAADIFQDTARFHSRSRILPRGESMDWTLCMFYWRMSAWSGTQISTSLWVLQVALQSPVNTIPEDGNRFSRMLGLDFVSVGVYGHIRCKREFPFIWIFIAVVARRVGISSRGFKTLSYISLQQYETRLCVCLSFSCFAQLHTSGIP